MNSSLQFPTFTAIYILKLINTYTYTPYTHKSQQKNSKGCCRNFHLHTKRRRNAVQG